MKCPWIMMPGAVQAFIVHHGVCCCCGPEGGKGGRAGDGLMCTAVDIITFYNYFSVGSRVVNSNSPRGNIRSGSAIYTLVGWHKTKSTTTMRVCMGVNLCVCVSECAWDAGVHVEGRERKRNKRNVYRLVLLISLFSLFHFVLRFSVNSWNFTTLSKRHHITVVVAVVANCLWQQINK